MVLYSVNLDFTHNLCSFFGLGVLTQNSWVLVKTKLRKVTGKMAFLYAKDIFEYNLWRVNRNQCWYTDIRYTLTLIIVNASLRRDCMSNSKHVHIFVFVSLRIFDYEELNLTAGVFHTIIYFQVSVWLAKSHRIPNGIHSNLYYPSEHHFLCNLRFIVWNLLLH